jgi:hypothetical protein
MKKNFIKFETENHEYHINPLMITQITKSKLDNSAIIHIFGSGSFRPKENFDEVMKKIDDSNKFTFQL